MESAAAQSASGLRVVHEALDGLVGDLASLKSENTQPGAAAAVVGVALHGDEPSVWEYTLDYARMAKAMAVVADEDLAWLQK